MADIIGAHDYEPSEQERMLLSQVSPEALTVIRKIGLSEVARFQVKQINLDPEHLGANYDKVVLETQRLTKAAAMIWQGLWSRIEAVRFGMENAMPDDDVPGKITEEDLANLIEQ